MNEKTKLFPHLYHDTGKPILTDSSMVDLSNAVKGTENKTLDDFYSNWLKHIYAVSVADITNFGAIKTRNGIWYPAKIDHGKSVLGDPTVKPIFISPEFNIDVNELVKIMKVSM